jgi:hypothetical protein
MATPVAVQDENEEELLFAAVVRILSEDLYPRKLEIIREYIQNSSDAIDDWLAVADHIHDQTDPQIKISIQGRSLIIWDNGIGMSEEDIPKLKRIAYSEKRLGEEAGYKGIGKLAGVAVAEKLKITTTSYGDRRLWMFEFRAGNMWQDISEKKRHGIQEPASPVIRRHTSIEYTDVDPNDHYTIVEIRNIKESCSELLDADQIAEFVGDVAPVAFDPLFEYAEFLNEGLFRSVPDYSPKKVLLSRPDGRKSQIFKPFNSQMMIAKPDFIEVKAPGGKGTLAVCWYTTNAQKMGDKVRPSGRIFSVAGDTVLRRRRFAGLAYKLFGFSIGDRSLPTRTLWTTAKARAEWFTGEIHIVDKGVLPLTDRSDFVDTGERARLYKQSQEYIVEKLNDLAQLISDNRRAFHGAEEELKRVRKLRHKLDDGGVQRSDIKVYKRQLEEGLQRLKNRKCNDLEIRKIQQDALRELNDLRADIDDPKKQKRSLSIADLGSDLKMTTKAQRVFEIIMGTLQTHFDNDMDSYEEVAAKIHKALRDKY